MTDLTMQSDYATMLGYTQRELEENFVEEIEMAAIHLQLSTSLSITHKSNLEDLWVMDRPVDVLDGEKTSSSAAYFVMSITI